MLIFNNFTECKQLNGVNPITRFFPGPNRIANLSADLSSFGQDPSHDEDTSKDLYKVGEDYLDESNKNSVVEGIQSEIMEVENTNDNHFGDNYCTKTEKTCSTSAPSELNRKAELQENIIQPEDKVILKKGFESHSNQNDRRPLCPVGSKNEELQANSLYQSTKNSVSSSEIVGMQTEDAGLVDVGIASERESSEIFTSGCEQQPVLKKESHPESVVDRKLGSSKLEDIWQRCGTSSSSTSKVQQNETITWSYKPEEIDESVLTELPEEIQQELRSRFKLKRSRTTKHPTIGDYFKSNSHR
eukprot:Gb_31130 [translate_table: standard]